MMHTHPLNYKIWRNSDHPTNKVNHDTNSERDTTATERATSLNDDNIEII